MEGRQDNDSIDILEPSVNSPKIGTSTHFRSERVGCQISQVYELVPPLQPPYSPTRDTHLPNNMESRRTKREQEYREVQNPSLKDKIAEFNENPRRMQEK